MYRLKSSRVTLAAGSSNVHVDGEGTYIHRAGGFGNAELIRTWHACGYSIRIHTGSSPSLFACKRALKKE